LWTENGILNDQLEVGDTFLQTNILQRYDEKYRKIDVIERTLKHVFSNFGKNLGIKQIYLMILQGKDLLVRL
jgi:hypothetical protein